jgi:hypothetical protein
MNHETVDFLFEKYMDGELDPSAQAEFEEHIKNCTECAERYAGFVKIKNGLSSIGDEPIPDGFREEWTQSLRSYGKSSKGSAKRMRGFLPAIAAGVALVAVVSAVMLSGVLSPGAAMPEVMIAGSAESQAAADRTMQDSAAKDAAGENEALPAPESSESLFMMQEAPKTSAAPETSAETSSSAAGADKISIPLYVTQAAFDALVTGLEEQNGEFCLDEGLLIFTVTQDNQSFFADFAQRYALGVSPLLGEIYEIWIAG